MGTIRFDKGRVYKAYRRESYESYDGIKKKRYTEIRACRTYDVYIDGYHGVHLAFFRYLGSTFMQLSKVDVTEVNGVETDFIQGFEIDGQRFIVYAS